MINKENKVKYVYDTEKVKRFNKGYRKIKLVIGIIGLVAFLIGLAGLIWFTVNHLGDGIGAILRNVLDGVKK